MTRLLLLSAALLLGCASTVPGSRTDGGPAGAAICHAAPAARTTTVADAILSGYGSGGFRIDTRSPEAQAYFDNGMQLAHAFAHGAATAAFRRAEALDPTCAMCVWGEAWSLGPTINFTIDDGREKTAAALVERAATLVHDSKEAALIAALGKRYHDGGGAGVGDDAFAQAMDDLARAYPADDEIAILAADAWMIPASQREDSGGRDPLDRAVALLAGVLKRSPDDSAAIHFYIHATEMNGEGADALASAERLQRLAPSASHLVHMPSHVYFWVGRYRASTQSNVDAVAIDDGLAASTLPEGGIDALPYHAHNVRFGTISALMAGDAADAVALATPRLARLAAIKPDEAWPQVDLAAAYFAYGRAGNDAAVRALPEPPDTMPFARAMWHYAEGEAAARRHDVAALTAQAEAIEPLTLKLFGGNQKEGEAMVGVVRAVLDGRIAMFAGQYRQAADSYRRAAELQEGSLQAIADPPLFWYPVRRSLAAALLADGDAAAAEREARSTLARWKDDPVALAILSGAAERQGRGAESRALMAFARTRWSGDLSSVSPALM